MDAIRTHRFRSMGTTVDLIAPDAPGFDVAAADVELLFASLDHRFSRFRDNSELSKVNARAGRWTHVSQPFADVLAMALRGAGKTDGLFDPTVLPALLAAGYDRDFAELRTGGVEPSDPPARTSRWRDIEVDDLMVRLPENLALDFGGVAKGWAVDRACEAARRLPWAVVDAGGDLRVTGGPPDGGLDIAVEDPLDRGTEILRLKVEEGAVATSSVMSRTWGPGLHQLIDPRTSRPSSTGVLQATVCAETCAQAEIRSKWALLTGSSALDQVPAVLVLTDGRILTNLRPETNGTRSTTGLSP
jgi:FAD:protein FMN transferase